MHVHRWGRVGLFFVILACGTRVDGAYPAPRDGSWTLGDFRFSTGETLPSLRLHYRTIGEPVRDAAGRVRNAVLIMHGTGGSGAQFLQPHFADEMFGPGQPLDAATHFIILPDAIGHGQSSKPSDGLRMRFPRYTYVDIVRAQYRLVTEHLGVDHLWIVMGTSMGGMQTWMWGEMYPTFMDALVPLASLPTSIAGRNRMARRMMINAIRDDPAWSEGNYTEQPRRGLTAATYVIMMATSVPLHWYTLAPTPEQADAFLADEVRKRVAGMDANDTIYHFDASRDYDPSPHLERIVAPLLAINSADDQVNPPELGLMERLIPRVPRASYLLIPISAQTRGHGSHTYAALWRDRFVEFLATVKPANR